MPEKLCECGQKSHVRVKICPSCKKEFTKKEKLSKKKSKSIDTDITIGGWAKDVEKGMPKIEEPEPLPANKRLSVAEVREIVSYESLGYAILTYIQIDQILDEDLKILWIDAKEKMKKIINILYNII
jgi:hypothetical protein